jgi:hypothetical protein
LFESLRGKVNAAQLILIESEAANCFAANCFPISRALLIASYETHDRKRTKNNCQSLAVRSTHDRRFA